MIALALIGCTVHFWNVLYAFFFFFIGLAGWIADPVRVRAAARQSRKRAQRETRMPYPIVPVPTAGLPQPA